MRIIRKKGNLDCECRWLNKLWMTVVLLVVFTGVSSAKESAIYQDCSEDFDRYARTVALFNRSFEYNGSQDVIPKTMAGDVLQVVLCQTDGAALSLWEEGLKATVEGPENHYTLYYDCTETARQAVSHYRSQRGMIYAEVDSEVFACENEQGEYESISFRSWGATELHYAQYINFVARWAQNDVVVAVVDSGVCRHPMIESRILESGFDYIDIDEDATNDLFGHGTHVAGIIADCTFGLSVMIYPVRVLNEFGSGRISNIVNAVLEAQLKGVDVLNLSIATGVMSDALDATIREARDNGVTVVIAAGNNNADTDTICPAHMQDEGVIVVGAAERLDGTIIRAPYSNFGKSVDVYAFGTDIVSCAFNEGYSANTGTSMAAPHISALCAMLRQIHPDLSPPLVERRLLGATDPGKVINVPDLRLLVPASESFYLHNLVLREGESIGLPKMAAPSSCREAIDYSVHNEAVATVTEGKLSALQKGRTDITARCVGFEDLVFTVEVLDSAETGRMNLPEGLTELQDESLSGNASLETILLPENLILIGDHVFDMCYDLRWMKIPKSVKSIGENNFEDAVILCDEGSEVQDYAENIGVQFIATKFDETE